MPLEHAAALGITGLARIHSALGNFLVAHGCPPGPTPCAMAPRAPVSRPSSSALAPRPRAWLPRPSAPLH
eukprot:7368289-Alexandrium_andersonii.AAC.1